MNKFLKAVTAIGCAFVMTFGFTACDFGEEAKSAYQLAVENGFVGTEDDWFKSLKGADGEDGKDLDIEEIYETAQKNGYEGSFLEFLKEYLSVEVSENNNTDIITHNLMSVVSVYCSFTVTQRVSTAWGGTRYQTSIRCSAGSGVIYRLDKDSGNAYIITNYHVIYDADSDNKIADNIYLYLYGGLNGFDTSTGKDTGGGGIAAKYVGGAMNYDIAVLEVQGSNVLRQSDAEKAEIGDSDSVAAGEKVFAIGNPEGAGISVTSGTLSVDSEYIQLTTADEKSTADFRVMRTDAAINSGNSGGALFNAQGKLIGITNAKRVDVVSGSSVDSVDNIGYALPITQVKYVVNNILDNGGAVKRALFGITLQVIDSRGYYNETLNKAVVVETVKVASISVGSIANGVFRTGDIIKSITVGGETVTVNRRHQIIDRMLTVRKGDTVSVTVSRGGIDTELTVTFSEDRYFETVA